MRTSRGITGLAGLLIIMLLGCSGPSESESSAPANCASTARLSRLTAWSGDLAADTLACLEIELEQGAFVRIALAIDSGLVDVSLLEPGAPEPRLVIALGGGLRPPKQLSWEAEAEGVHTVSFTGLQLSEALMVARGIRATVLELESPASRARRKQQLRSDPRVGWLRDNAIRLRSIDPRDQLVGS